MDAIIRRIPSPADLEAWFNRNRAKIAGLLAGTLGLFIFTTFLTVAITGVPYGGERLDPDRTVVYPNF